MIIDNYLSGKAHNFTPDPVVSTLSFSSKVIPDNVEMFPGASLTKGVHSYVAKQNKHRCNQNIQCNRYEEVPADFPTDICFHFNYRQCHDDNCPRAHVCRKCQGKHRADACREKTKRS